MSAPTKTHKLADGTDFYRINPLGYVPLLELDDGRRLHKGLAIVQYIADQAPDKNLAPANGSFERYKLQEWLSFIGTELHKGFSPLFNPPKWVEGELAGRQYLMGDTFSVADAYLFTATNWAPSVALDISGLPHLLAYRARVAARTAVIAAMKAEGLIK